MSTKSRFVLLIIIFSAGYQMAAGQEYILPLASNPVLSKQSVQVKKSATADTVMLELPVVDDFSYNSPYPSSEIWADKYAFVNRGYPVNPPTIGAATLDALDSDGSVYSFATISPETFDADFLTSLPINLDYPASDSIYLSFFYQPMGNGLEPGEKDSLCLDFYDPDSARWTNVWRVPGDSLDAFKQVMIPIKDPAYLKQGFRFGFRNKASLPLNDDYKDKRGNVDHWNIDYVRLDRNRSITSTLINDVAYSQIPSSMLRSYSSLPWDHFKIAFTQFFTPKISIKYTNLDNITRNVTRYLTIEDESTGEIITPVKPTAQDILSSTTTSYDFAFNYPFDYNKGDTASFILKSWLRTDDFDYKANDTVFRRQVFKDYFSYDDGTAERAYGLRGQGTSNGVIAIKFNSFIPDKLGGVDVYFTQLKDSLNLNYYFKFMVWNDNDGTPGQILYEGVTDHTVTYADALNKYVRFFFDHTVNVDGPFYVGILQYNQYLINIGLDINTPHNGNLFYNLGSGWQVSNAPGSLLLRPFVQRSYSAGIVEPGKQSGMISIWPNPSSEFLRIQPSPEINLNDLNMTITDITGKKIRSYAQVTEEIYTGDLPEGLYFMIFSKGNTLFSTEKLLIRR